MHNVERFAFPAVIAAAIVTLWIALRKPATAPVSAPQASGAPIQYYPAFLVPQSSVILTPTRRDPPAPLSFMPINGLKYPADLSTLAVIEESPAAGEPCGCCS